MYYLAGALLVLVPAYGLGRHDIVFWVVIAVLAISVVELIKGIATRRRAAPETAGHEAPPLRLAEIATRSLVILALIWAAWLVGRSVRYF